MSDKRTVRSYSAPGEITLEDILDMAWSWRPAVLVLQAHQAGIFDAASGGWKRGEAIAGAIGADARATRLVLLGLAGAGMMMKRGDEFKNAPAVERYLVKDSPDYKGHLLDLDGRGVGNWNRIGEIIKSGKPIEKPEQTDEQKRGWQETFILAMDVLASRHLDKMFRALPLVDGHSLLDIGCGPATYLVGFLKRLQNCRGTGFDRPESERVVRMAGQRGGVSDRLQFTGGDFNTSDFDFGVPFNGALISQVIHMLSGKQSADLIRRAVGAVRAGGFVAVHEMTLGPDDNPGPAGLFAVQMMLGTPEGGVYTKDEISGWMEAAGLAIESVVRIDERSEVIVGRK